MRGPAAGTQLGAVSVLVMAGLETRARPGLPPWCRWKPWCRGK